MFKAEEIPYIYRKAAQKIRATHIIVFWNAIRPLDERGDDKPSGMRLVPPGEDPNRVFREVMKKRHFYAIAKFELQYDDESNLKTPILRNHYIKEKNDN